MQEGGCVWQRLQGHMVMRENKDTEGLGAFEQGTLWSRHPAALWGSREVVMPYRSVVWSM